MKSDTKKLKQLGSNKTKYPQKPEDAVLETFKNQHLKNLYLVPFVCTEFTSLCPRTGQPDFARFEIVYVPREKMIESKALKLYLFSFRNQGEFHEDVTNRIFNDLWEVMDPYYMRVFGDFTIRGGIAIKPIVERFAGDVYESMDSKIIRLVEQWDKLKFQIHEYK